MDGERRTVTDALASQPDGLATPRSREQDIDLTPFARTHRPAPDLGVRVEGVRHVPFGRPTSEQARHIAEAAATTHSLPAGTAAVDRVDRAGRYDEVAEMQIPLPYAASVQAGENRHQRREVRHARRARRVDWLEGEHVRPGAATSTLETGNRNAGRLKRLKAAPLPPTVTLSAPTEERLDDHVVAGRRAQP